MKNFTSLRDNNIGTSELMLKTALILRKSRIGRLISDNSSSHQFDGFRYKNPYQIEFPDVYMRFVRDIKIVQGYVAIKDDDIIIDHLTSFKGRSDGSFYLESGRDAIIMGRINKHNNHAPIHKVEITTLIVHNEGGGTWGHWLIQNLPKIVLFKSRIPDGRVALPRLYTLQGNSYSDSLFAFGLTKDDIVEIDDSQTYIFENAVFIDNLYHDGAAHPFTVEIFDGLTLEKTNHKDIFIERLNNGKSRSIENHSEITSIARMTSFEVIRLGEQPFAHQASIWASMNRTISILGSDMTGIILARSGSEIFSVSPDFHRDRFFFDLAAAKGLTWNEMLCGKVGVQRQPAHLSNFIVSGELFYQFIQ